MERHRADIALKLDLKGAHTLLQFAVEHQLALGAQGYVLKDSAVTDIVACIRAVAAGQNYVSPALTSYLFQQRPRALEAKPSGIESLSPTERQILKLIADYKTSKQIAAALYISPHTV